MSPHKRPFRASRVSRPGTSPPRRFLSGYPVSVTALKHSVGLNAKFDSMMESISPKEPEASQTHFPCSSSIRGNSDSKAHLDTHNGFRWSGQVGEPLMMIATRDGSGNVGHGVRDLGDGDESPRPYIQSSASTPSSLRPIYPAQHSDEITLVDDSPYRSLNGKTAVDNQNWPNYQQSISSDHHRPESVIQDSTGSRLSFSVLTHLENPISAADESGLPVYAPLPRLAFAPPMSHHKDPTSLYPDSESLSKPYQMQRSGAVFNNIDPFSTPGNRVRSPIYFDSPTSDPFDCDPLEPLDDGYEVKVD